MKTKLATPLIVFLFLFLNGTAQDDIIRMRPELGKQYIYEFTESSYILASENEKRERSIRTKTYDIRFDNFEPENTEYLSVNIIKNTFERPDGTIPEYTDYRFPYFQEAFPTNESPDFTETLLSRLTLKYRFDFETSKIELLNREELIGEARNILNEKGLEPAKIDNRIQDFRESILPETTAQIQQIFQVPNVGFYTRNYGNDAFDINEKTQESLTELNLIRKSKQSGLYSINAVFDATGQILQEHTSVALDSLRYPYRFGDESYEISHTENNIRLEVSREIPKNMFTISGKIEDSKFRKATLAVLRSPFGTTVYEEATFLNEDNTFQIEAEIEHPQIVYLQFGNNFASDLPIMAFYAEPGSRIEFEASGDTFPWEVTFSGSFAGASNLLYNLQNGYNIFNERFYRNRFYFLPSGIDYSGIVSVFNETKEHLESRRNAAPQYVFDFLRKEIGAYFMGVFVYRLSIIDENRIISNGMPQNLNISPENLAKIRTIVDTFSIYNVYNEYGIYSRQMVENYTSYYFHKNKRVEYPQNSIFFGTMPITANEVYYANDLPRRVETAKNILAGHPFYAFLADLFSREKMALSNQPSSAEIYAESEIDNYLNLMTRVVNDPEFISSIGQLIDKHDNWEDEEFIPAIKFYDANGEAAYLSDFIGEKPAAIYVTQDWSRSRYLWDELAEENPGINFVLVMEGSNIQEWLDYTERAEPIAHQLFLLNDDGQLSDFFKSDYNHFIIYDKNGGRFAFAGDAISAKNLATQALNGSEERLDRSQLQNIILVLLIILGTFITGVILWRWRVRQRFRKEQQQRRLRELELTAIRSQMNPHFLFNSLNSVQNLVQQNKGREAHLYLSDFAGLIRKVLKNSEKEEVSLAEELETVQQYLSLEQLRFDFDYSVTIDERIDTNNTMVPSMLLQPFAENAVVHGLQNKSGHRSLTIDVARQNSTVKISVEDNGLGRQKAAEISQKKNGKSSHLMKERLEILRQKQGENYHLNIFDLNSGTTGTRVEIIVPEEN